MKKLTKWQLQQKIKKIKEEQDRNYKGVEPKDIPTLRENRIYGNDLKKLENKLCELAKGKTKE